VTVTWECARNRAGSGSLAAFHIMLMPAQAPAAGASSLDTVIRERIAIAGIVAGQRASWACHLTSPGHYLVEVAAENTAGQRSPPAVLALDVRPEAFPPPEDELAHGAPHWAEEPVLVLGPATEGGSQFGSFDPGTWLQTLLLWHDSNPAVAVASAIDVVCYFRRPGSSDPHEVVLASAVTSSRLQVALPAHVPMSLRLVVHNETGCQDVDVLDGETPRPPVPKVQSEPLLQMLSESSEQLRPIWEIWSRGSPDGQPPRWRPLPEELQNVLEAMWLEGQRKVSFEVQQNSSGEASNILVGGRYELVFGDDREVQHSLRRASSQWRSNARRVVFDGNGEDASAPMVAAEDQCVVCMERRRTHAFMHHETGDGHLAVCGGCAEAYRVEAIVGGAPRHVRQCPMCRRPFSAVQRIYQ